MSIFEFFFKYKPIIYQKGHLAFQLIGSPVWFLLFVAAAAAGAWYAYKNVTGEKWSAGSGYIFQVDEVVAECVVVIYRSGT